MRHCASNILSNGSRVGGIGSMAATACEAVIGSIPMPTASKNSANIPSGMPGSSLPRRALIAISQRLAALAARSISG